jgi:hypothetical protein
MKVEGWGILLRGGVLAHDHRNDRPYFVRTRRAAQRGLLKGLPPWQWEGAKLVRVTYDDESRTYTVHKPPEEKAPEETDAPEERTDNRRSATPEDAPRNQPDTESGSTGDPDRSRTR